MRRSVNPAIPHHLRPSERGNKKSCRRECRKRTTDMQMAPRVGYSPVCCMQRVGLSAVSPLRVPHRNNHSVVVQGGPRSSLGPRAPEKKRRAASRKPRLGDVYAKECTHAQKSENNRPGAQACQSRRGDLSLSCTAVGGTE